MDNFTILPAFSNENEALNALALGLFHFGTEDIFTPDSVKNLINNALNSPFLANIRIKLNIQNYNTIIQHQKDLAENLITELYTKISDQINLPNSEFFNELYQPFEYAFLLYCANKNKFNHNRIPIYDLNNNRYLKTLSEFRKFSEFFKKKFTEDAEFSTFDRIYKNNNNNNTFSIENSLQAINLHTENLLNNPSPYPLREQWSYLYNIYLNAIKENEIL